MLVLCRSRASQSLVRRWIVARGGLLGVDVATVSGLAAQTYQPPLLAGAIAPRPPHDTLPTSTAIAARIGARPGLCAHARRWAQAARAAVESGLEPTLPPWLDELHGSDWGLDDDEAAQLALLRAARSSTTHANGEVMLSTGYRWDRVVLLGFDGPPATAAPLERATAEALSGTTPIERAATPAAIPSVQVPDVAAEARLAARVALGDPMGTLVLVADDTTARRVRAALWRNGLACAHRERRALQVHALASVVRRCAEWMHGPDPQLRAADLASVFAQTSLRRPLHPAAEAWIDAGLEAQGLDRGHLRWTRPGVLEVLREARVLDAPLTRWIRRLEVELGVLTEEPTDRSKRIAAGAWALAARLRVLEAIVRGVDPDRHLFELSGGELSFDDDDFDAMVAELLGDALGVPETPDAGSLGALKNFLVALRVRVHDDPVARAILGSLRSNARWSAGPTQVYQALSGAVDPGVLSGGVSVVRYDDYDGRPIRQAILLDVHDKGLARRPVPDPLLDDATIATLGLLSGRAVVEHRVHQAHRVAQVAERVLALVSRRDAGGRDVVAPIQLDLVASEVPGAPSYGIGLPELPESARLAALQAVRSATPEPPEHADPHLSMLAIQGTAEWVRAGRGMPSDPTTPAPAGHALLTRQLEQAGPIAPPWVMPWLGHALDVPEAVLDAGPHAATGLLTEVSQCLYRAFVRRVLRVRPLEELSEDLDPREVGEAVHDALERVAGSDAWPPDASDPSAVVGALRVETGQAFKASVQRLGALSEPRTESIRGRTRRWNAHWPAWAASRIQRPRDSSRWLLTRQLRLHPATLAADEVLLQTVPAAVDQRDYARFDWMAEIGTSTPAAAARLGSSSVLAYGRRSMPESWLPDLPAFFASDAFAALHRAVVGLRLRLDTRSARLQAVEVELPFGPSDDAGPAVTLPLGSEPLAVRGRIDRLEVRAAQDSQWLVITDIKTGTGRPDWAFRRDVSSLRDPQLVVYALVVRELQRAGHLVGDFATATVALVQWDQIKATFKEPANVHELAVPATLLAVDDTALDALAAELGRLVDRARSGRWTLRPRGDVCPALRAYGHTYCPYDKACRMRGLPESS